MTDKSPSDCIRAMLDECGVEYTTEDMPTNKQTYWGDWCFMEPLDAKPHTLGAQCELMLIPATPEQAIAATLGIGIDATELAQTYDAGFKNGVMAVFQQLEGIKDYDELQCLIAEYWAEGEGNDER